MICLTLTLYIIFRSIPSAAFHHVKQLEYLSLAHNQISDLATRDINFIQFKRRRQKGYFFERLWGGKTKKKLKFCKLKCTKILLKLTS